MTHQPPQCLQSVLGQRGGALEEVEYLPNHAELHV
jgi:hypothetical protein